MLGACPIVEMTLKVSYCRPNGLRIRCPRIEKSVQNLSYPWHLIFRGWRMRAVFWHVCDHRMRSMGNTEFF
jgi:hypothetical protein